MKDPEHLELAREVFSGTDIKITTAGKRHLGASLGSMEFRAEYASEKVDKWCREIERLSEFVRSQPHAAYAAYIHGEQHRFRFFMRTIPGMEEYLKPLDDAINLRLIPALVGNDLNNEERALFSLPTRDGGMGIPILTEAAPTEFISSTTVNAPLAAIIALQETELPDENVVRDVVQEDRRRRAADSKNKTERINNALSASTLRAVTQAPNWLSSRPSNMHGFKLNKTEFHDAIAICHNNRIKDLPSTCVCGHAFDINHAMNCKRGGFVTIRHNEVRNFEATLLSKVCCDVEVEPSLQPLTGEVMQAGVTKGDQARLDVRARGFWRRG